MSAEWNQQLDVDGGERYEKRAGSYLEKQVREWASKIYLQDESVYCKDMILSPSGSILWINGIKHLTISCLSTDNVRNMLDFRNSISAHPYLSENLLTESDVRIVR